MRNTFLLVSRKVSIDFLDSSYPRSPHSVTIFSWLIAMGKKKFSLFRLFHSYYYLFSKWNSFMIFLFLPCSAFAISYYWFLNEIFLILAQFLSEIFLLSWKVTTVFQNFGYFSLCWLLKIRIFCHITWNVERSFHIAKAIFTGDFHLCCNQSSSGGSTLCSK